MVIYYVEGYLAMAELASLDEGDPGPGYLQRDSAEGAAGEHTAQRPVRAARPSG